MMEVTEFSGKLNQVEGKVYVIEEEIRMPENGVYEALLEHDNIQVSTLTVYTGPKLTGDRIQSYALSTPTLTPWKRLIRIQTEEPVVYIAYETEGDTVEAEDVNRLQEAMGQTQQALNAEEERALQAEGQLREDVEQTQEDLEEEAARAQQAEGQLQGMILQLREDLDVEEERALQVEGQLQGAISQTQQALSAETTRAQQAEGQLGEDLEDHLGDTNNPHGVTAAQVGLEKVANKSPSEILSEMTAEDITAALGYTPADEAGFSELPDTGVAAGTYTRVTVDTKGRVTAGESPTTLAGYGITDALKKGGVTWADLGGG